VSSTRMRKSRLYVLVFSINLRPVLKNQPGALRPQVDPVLPPPLYGSVLFAAAEDRHSQILEQLAARSQYSHVHNGLTFVVHQVCDLKMLRKWLSDGRQKEEEKGKA
jgi:hypothetical protein